MAEEWEREVVGLSQEIYPSPVPPQHPTQPPSSLPISSICSWMEQLFLPLSPRTSPTAAARSDIRELFNVCFASCKCNLVAGNGEETT